MGELGMKIEVFSSQFHLKEIIYMLQDFSGRSTFKCLIC